MSRKFPVDIFIPCFVDQMYPETGMNMVKILRQLGCEVRYNENQTCCGQPAFNAGFLDEARLVGEKFLKDFNTGRYVVAPSASCVGMVRNSYLKLFQSTPFLMQFRRVQGQIFEFSEFVTKILKKDRIEGAKLEAIATYHDSCSALRECKIKEAPRALLSNVEGLVLKEMKDTDTCCGFGGTFAVKFESISAAMADQKVTNASEAGAEIIISTDTSCLFHLEGYIGKQGHKLKTMHLVDVLASGW